MLAQFGTTLNSTTGLDGYKIATDKPADPDKLFELEREKRVFDLINLQDERPLTDSEKKELKVLSNSLDEVTVIGSTVKNANALSNIPLAVIVGLVLFFILRG